MYLVASLERGDFMKCVKCPLYSPKNNEISKCEECKLFGDSWDSPFLYYNDEGAIIGCYIEKVFIDRFEERIEIECKAYADYMLKQERINDYGTTQI